MGADALALKAIIDQQIQAIDSKDEHEEKLNLISKYGAGPDDGQFPA